MNLNLDLTEAIALGHDLGHTPFGHQGERTLKEILEGKKLDDLFKLCPAEFSEDLIEKCDFQNNQDLTVATIMGGFKHNFQGIRVLTTIEERYVEFQGLDISIQTLEGILKHTKLKDAEIEHFINKDFIEDFYTELPFSITLEGQVVAVADEIAQRGHDIDDALTSGLITTEKLIEALNIKKYQKLYSILNEQNDSIAQGTRHYVSEKELVISRFVSKIVSFFISDVIDNSQEKINCYIQNNKKSYFEEELIGFSSNIGKSTCDFLEKVVNKKVVGNSEVACFDYNADVIIEKLFKAYYRNPKLLNESTLRRIYIEQLQHPNYLISKSAIDLVNGNLDVIREEIFKITTIQCPNDEFEEDEFKEKEEENYRIFEKRRILVRNIVDYIAGMTDSYAINDYERIK